VVTISTPAEITSNLAPGERILWKGVPKQGYILRKRDALMIPFTLLWGGSVVFWEGGVIKSGVPWYLTFWGVPFLLVGFYLVFGRFWVDRGVRARTVYAVTDQRVLFLSGFANRTLTSLELSNLPPTNLSVAGDGSGTITFGTFSTLGASALGSPGWPGGQLLQAPAFEGIADAAKVLAIIRAAQTKRD